MIPDDPQKPDKDIGNEDTAEFESFEGFLDDSDSGPPAADTEQPEEYEDFADVIAEADALDEEEANADVSSEPLVVEPEPKQKKIRKKRKISFF